MSKELSEMSLEELWRLFPIILTEHDPRWRDWYGEEAARLRAVLPVDEAARISHIGSTAVAGIWAKPTVDILLEARGGFEGVKNALLDNGYRLMSQSEGRLSFNKGYTPQGFAERVFHLHLRKKGDNDELYFRDYLRTHPDVAREYEKLKLGLWKKYEHNRDLYTQSKTDFVRKYTELAKKEYGDRYKEGKND